MNKYKQSILIAMAILLVASMALFIAYGNNGLIDLNLKKVDKNNMIERNKKLEKVILSHYRQIDRLKNDLEFIKVLAKHELGWVEKDELVFKMKSNTEHRTSNIEHQTSNITP